ncbi:hypothetical protein BaRGS_00008676 [Batillaria attramentaria]|uniref:G-protein coupled receptors family 2 profile 2 domain-containing protein n=1 Tax=Batillaria attramentaria TaxID=370345 RepID=A0ABD0LKU1_9CAEN
MSTVFAVSFLPFLGLALLSFVGAPPTTNTPTSHPVLHHLGPQASPSGTPPPDKKSDHARLYPSTSPVSYFLPTYPNSYHGVTPLDSPSSSTPATPSRAPQGPMTSKGQHDRSALSMNTVITPLGRVLKPTADEVIFWKQVADAYFDFCGYSCESGVTDGHLLPKCQKCYCDDVCFVYGDCCPDKYYHAGHGPTSKSFSNNIRCSRLSTASGPRWHGGVNMVVECPEDFEDRVTAERCKSGNLHWSIATPVTSKNTQMTFKNKYCAQCYYEHDLISWNVHIGAMELDMDWAMDTLSDNSSADEKYRAALSDNRYHILFENPTLTPTRHCGPDTVSECSKRIDAEVEKAACLAFSAPVLFCHRKFGGLVLFRNPFCLLCNSDKTWQELFNATCEMPASGGGFLIPLLHLVDFSGDDNGDESDEYTGPAAPVFRDIPQDVPQHASMGDIPQHASTGDIPQDANMGDIPQHLQCAESDFLGEHTNSCRKILCAKEKERPANASVDDNCRSIPVTTGHYGYKFCLRTSMTELKMTSLVTSLNPAHLKNAFQWMTETYGLVLQNFHLYKLYPSLKDTGEVDLSEFLMHVRLLPSRPIDRDFVDQSLITNMAEILERLDRHLNTSGLQIAASCSKRVLQDLAKLAVEHADRFPNISFSSEDFLQKEDNESDTVYLPVNKLLICPFVTFNISEEAVFDPKTPQDLVIEFSDKNLSVSLPDFYIDRRGASVCLYQLKPQNNESKPDWSFYTPQNNESKPDGSFYTPQNNESKPDWSFYTPQENSETNQTKTEGVPALHVVSLFCTIISLVFLLVSFVVYCLLSELRHIAGINNMLLIVVLFWAQIFLQVASYADLPSWLCQAVGVATHFLWLCVVFAQSACTFHMFYTLSFPLRSHAANMNVRVMVTRYFVFVLTSSSVFVVTVLVWQFVAEGNSGYGGSPCYIRKLAVRVTMFVLPLAVTVLLNIAMFVFTIVRLRSPSRARCSRSNRNNLILYIKLSVFTGVTWLLGFLASALASVALIYLFVVLQGCQGLFIFLAFLANKRVLAMLRGTESGQGLRTPRTHAHSDVPPKG